MELSKHQIQTWKLFFQNWFLGNEDYVVCEQCYVYHLMDEVYDFIQSKYKQDNIETITLYRWESNVRKQKILSSWTTNQSAIDFYKNKYNGNGFVVAKNVDVKQILFDTNYMDELFEQYNLCWDEIIGVYPDNECIIIEDNSKWIHQQNI